MKVCSYNGIDVVVLTRDEHCPPHLHVGTKDWSARFKFAFWHDEVSLWDLDVKKKSPTTATLEAMRMLIQNPANLKKARSTWWYVMSSVCLNNKYLDMETYDVVDGKDAKRGMPTIRSSRFDEVRYSTVLRLSNEEEELEFKL